jgi:hypothetical protein
MSLFDSASIVVTPNAYKASKLYAIKPTDGSGDLTVVRATTATRVNSTGLIESVANNVPRLDYTNSTCPSILVEPQRRNLVRRSEEFNDIAWAKSVGITVTANNIISPDGTQNADKIVFSGANEFINQFNVLSAVAHIGSVYIKGTAGETIRFTVGGTEATRTLTGEWQRIELLRATAPSNGNFTISTFSGVTARTIYLWGAQIEAGANATSYIPTTSASVTRNADLISKTGISDLIGQTEGTIFVDCKDVKVGLSRLFEIFNLSNTSTNIFLNLSSSGAVQIILNGATVNTATGNVVDLDKVIFKYTSDSIKLFNNGVLIGSYSGAVSFSNALNTLSIGGTTYTTRTINGNIKLLGLWKTALTDQECINLTTI